MMRLYCAVAICLLAFLAPTNAQEVLKAWEFNTPGDSEGWFPAHSLAPFVVEGGTLKTSVTDTDPYLHDSAGEAFQIEANRYQYIEVRMRHDSGTGGEFFWANTVQGADAGFRMGKERGFPCEPDGEWHVYHVYPLWEGEITRLRLDPPGEGEGEIEIDYIRIIQAPIGTHDPESPTWDFANNSAGWVTISGADHLSPTADGIETTLNAETATVVSGLLDLNADSFQYAYIQFSTSAPVEAGLAWSSTTDGNFPACNLLDFRAPEGNVARNLRLTDHVMYGGEIKGLRLTLTGDPGTKVVLKRLELAPEPQGPRLLELLSLAPDPALLTVGDTGRLVATVRNNGGEPVLAGADRGTLTLGAEEPVSLQTPASQDTPLLAPGETSEISWPFTMLRPGAATVTLSGPDGLAGRVRVICSKPFPAPERATKPTAVVTEEAAWIGNRRVTLLLTKNEEGFAHGQLRLLDHDRVRTMAALPHLAALALEGMDEPVGLAFQEATVQQADDSASLLLSGTNTVGGQTVRCTLTLSIEPDAWALDASYTLSSDADLSVQAFRGPWLWAGEGAFGDKQDLALFPGVEYMVAGEKSSSTLDIAPPANVRFAPHPNTITVPTMAVQKDGCIVGLMWDPLQKWAGDNQKPTAVFASPNFIEGYDNHLMGLCLPSIPDWMAANELMAETPYALGAGETMALSASLFARAGTDVTGCLDLYFDRFGIPPLPPKARSYTDTIQMSMKSYEDVLWVEEAGGWMGVIGWAPGRSPAVALDYMLAARHIEDKEFADALLKKGLSLADPGDMASALNHFGDLEGQMSRVLAAGRAQARSVPDDGRYGFVPTDERCKSLGTPGTTAVGLCARAIRPVLTSALRTGDDAPLQAAFRTLDFMKRFKVPRASQVWEVPVHTPDVLASADACDVYLIAYRLTQNTDYLKEAVYWARTGLPFIYMWQAPEQRDLMLGSSIAVFGATFYTGSWFARPVQWNGLSYARVLLDLAKYDRSLPWRHFAEMITISGMNQQTTREKDYGTYTDNWDIIDDVECVVCMLAPGAIMLNAMDLMGKPTGAQTAVLFAPEGRIAVSAPQVSDAEYLDGAAHFRLHYDPGYTAYAAVMPISEPDMVQVNGRAIARQDGTLEAPEGWSYAPGTGCLTLKLTFGEEWQDVRISPVRRIEPQLPVPAWEFNTDAQAEGWTEAHGVEPFVVKGGSLFVETSGADPYIYGPSMIVDAAAHPGIVFRARATREGGQFFFSSEKGGFAPERSLPYHLPADGEFHDVTIDLSNHPEWTGMINRLRLDFGDPPCTVEIDWVRLLGTK